MDYDKKKIINRKYYNKLQILTFDLRYDIISIHEKNLKKRFKHNIHLHLNTVSNKLLLCLKHNNPTFIRK